MLCVNGAPNQIIENLKNKSPNAVDCRHPSIPVCCFITCIEVYGGHDLFSLFSRVKPKKAAWIERTRNYQKVINNFRNVPFIFYFLHSS